MKIVKVLRKEYYADIPANAEINEMEYLFQTAIYDDVGNLLEETTYNQDKKIIHTYKYTYNEQNQIIEEFLLDEEGLVSEKKQFIWNENGLKIKEILYYSEDAYDITTFEYDKDKLLVAKKTVDEENVPDKIETFEYHNKNLHKHIIKDSSGKIIFDETNIYDEKNQLIESKIIENEEEMISTYKYSYDDKGNVTELLQYNDKNKLIYKRLYEYNEQNKVIKITEQDAGNKNTTYYDYDNNGNIVKEEEFNKLEQLNHAIMRKYDEANRILHVETVINRYGYGKNLHYELTYQYN